MISGQVRDRPQSETTDFNANPLFLFLPLCTLVPRQPAISGFPDLLPAVSGAACEETASLNHCAVARTDNPASKHRRFRRTISLWRKQGSSTTCRDAPPAIRIPESHHHHHATTYLRGAIGYRLGHRYSRKIKAIINVWGLRHIDSIITSHADAPPSQQGRLFRWSPGKGRNSEAGNRRRNKPLVPGWYRDHHAARRIFMILPLTVILLHHTATSSVVRTLICRGWCHRFASLNSRVLAALQPGAGSSIIQAALLFAQGSPFVNTAFGGIAGSLWWQAVPR